MIIGSFPFRTYVLYWIKKYKARITGPVGDKNGK
jgi:hypothetical protein